MKNSLNKIFNKANALALGILALGLIYGCEFELPGPGSKPDETPPDAAFTYASDAEDFKKIKFTNQSTESLSFLWDFGGGNTSDEVDPTFTFSDEGTFEVTLTSVDGLNVTSVFTQDVVVAPGPYQPIILEPGFEDGTLPDGSGDGRASWDAEWSSVIQISGSPVVSGSQAGKLPSDGARVAYQEIVVEPETNYDISFIYTLTNAVPGTLSVEILDVEANGGTFMTYDETRDHIIGSIVLNDQEDPSTYVGGEVSFASGSSALVAIMVRSTEGIESRFDDFAIQIGNSGGIPPSVSFELTQDADNYLLYSFANSSLNAATYMWEFGDGETSTEVSPDHTYAEAGWKTVKLTGTSEGGVTADFEITFEIHDPVEAGFEYTVDGFTVHLTDTSVNAVSLMWDFGDGFGASLEDPNHTYSQAGYYTISLVATSSTGLESEASVTLALGLPEIVNGDFSHPDGRDTNWKHGGWDAVVASTSAFNGSSDGSPLNYDGTPSGNTKTDGAKYTGGATANADGSPSASGNTRYAYQAVTLDPNTEYYIEFAHTVTSDGDRVVMEILDAQFPDKADGAITATRLITSAGGNVNGGKGNFAVVQEKFTTGANGDVSIWIWSNTTSDAWVDNVKILPAWLVEN